MAADALSWAVRRGLKDQRCSWSKRFCDSYCFESLRAFSSKLSAESLVASSADDSRVFCYVLAAFGVGCYMVEFGRIRLFTSVPVVGDATNRAEHVAAFKGCGEFLFSEVLPAGGAGAAGRHCFTPSLFHCLFVGWWWLLCGVLQVGCGVCGRGV